MVTRIVEHIGAEIKKSNTYFDSFAVNCFQLPNGMVVHNFYGDEMEEGGIDDCQGIAFYIRIEPKAQVFKKSKQFTSCELSHTAKQKCYLVAYNFESPKEIDSDKWVNKLAQSLSQVTYPKFINNPKIEIKDMDSSHIDNYIEETKKKFNVQKRFNCVKVGFEISYDLNLQDCDNCNIFKENC